MHWSSQVLKFYFSFCDIIIKKCQQNLFSNEHTNNWIQYFTIFLAMLRRKPQQSCVFFNHQRIVKLTSLQQPFNISDSFQNPLYGQQFCWYSSRIKKSGSVGNGTFFLSSGWWRLQIVDINIHFIFYFPVLVEDIMKLPIFDFFEAIGVAQHPRVIYIQIVQIVQIEQFIVIDKIVKTKASIQK